MTVGAEGRCGGVDIHLDPDECELFVKLARDAERAMYDEKALNYLSVCVRLGRCINLALSETRQPSNF
jgi:hypothetical protein